MPGWNTRTLLPVLGSDSLWPWGYMTADDVGNALLQIPISKVSSLIVKLWAASWETCALCALTSQCARKNHISGKCPQRNDVGWPGDEDSQMGGEFLVSPRVAYQFRIYDSKENPEVILAPGPGTNRCLFMLKVCSSSLWELTVSVKLPSAERWQDEWLLLLCLMMRLVFAVNTVTLGIM